MLRNGTRVLIAGVFALFLSTGVMAQAAGKIAVLNMARAMEATMEGKQAIADFQAKLTAKQNELQKKNSDLEEMRRQLQSQGQTMNDDARAALAKRIEQGGIELQRAQEDAQKEFQQMQQDIYGRLSVKMGPIIDQYAKENQISLLLDPAMQSSQVIFYDPAIEITDDIVKRYDAAPAAAPAAARPAATAPKPAAAAPVKK
jgi:outer membrane protein